MSQKSNEQLVAEEKKRLFIKVGVLIFSLLILVFWFFNLRASFNVDKGQIGENQGIDVWQEDFKKTIESARKGLDEPIVASSSNDTGQDFLNDLADNLEKKEGLPSISEPVVPVVPVETATLSPENLLKDLENRLPQAPVNNCPAFIDCMPTIGDAKPCLIPPGCENITQIAY
jgi:hypothetical protein